MSVCTALAPAESTDYVRGWNAAMSHAETHLVGMALRAGSLHVPAVGKQMAFFAQKIMLGAAEDIGRQRKPTKRHYG